MSEAWSCFSLLASFSPAQKSPAMDHRPGKCLISSDIQLPLYVDGILIKLRTAKTPRVFQGFSPAILDQVILLLLYTVALPKKEEYSFGNIFRSPVEMVSREKELCENRQLAYVKVKAAHTETLLRILHSKARRGREIYTHCVSAYPSVKKSSPRAQRSLGETHWGRPWTAKLHKSQSTLSHHQCPIGRPERSHWEKWSIYA